MEKTFFTVHQVNTYIKSIFEEDVILSEIFISGEISNFKRHSSNHLYFSLKDENASINCVMFKGNSDSLTFEPENGMKVMIFGRVSVYEKTGNYQLYVDLMQEAGKGELHLKFEALKNKLFHEGLFDVENKKEIPKDVNSVYVITSETSAALQDMLKMAKTINSGVQIIIIPTLVQGESAPKSIVNAIEIANKHNKCDMIILGRGGGSIEDLWAFNDENVARAIFSSKIPIVSAIGHETDFTIADFVSDLRAPTPTAAITMTFKDKREDYYNLRDLYAQLNGIIENKLYTLQNQIEALHFKEFYNKLYNKNMRDRQMLYKLYSRLTIKGKYQIDSKRLKRESLNSLLNIISPMHTMERGYSIVFKENKAVSTIDALAKDDKLDILLTDGKLEVKVTKIQKGGL